MSAFFPWSVYFAGFGSPWKESDLEPLRLPEDDATARAQGQKVEDTPAAQVIPAEFSHFKTLMHKIKPFRKREFEEQPSLVSIEAPYRLAKAVWVLEIVHSNFLLSNEAPWRSRGMQEKICLKRRRESYPVFKKLNQRPRKKKKRSTTGRMPTGTRLPSWRRKK